MRRRRPRLRWGPLPVAGAALALAGCAATDLAATTGGAPVDVRAEPPARALRAARPAAAPGTLTARVSPLDDPRGLHPGLAPVPAAQLGRARALIARVPVASARHAVPRDYRRKAFGPSWTDDQDATWGHDGCRTRDQILHRDLKAITFRAGTGDCVPLDGILQEPYLGRTVEFNKSRPQEVQIDHVVALSYAWTHGANRWTEAERRRFANDPLDLLAVDGPTNAAKGDDGPSTWLPPNPAVRCAYAVRVAQVVLAYGLVADAADRAASTRACTPK